MVNNLSRNAGNLIPNLIRAWAGHIHLQDSHYNEATPNIAGVYELVQNNTTYKRHIDTEWKNTCIRAVLYEDTTLHIFSPET